MTMAEAALAATILAQITFTFAVMIRAGRARFRAAKAGRTTGDIARDSRAWPTDVLARVDNMNNQFETPALFYALAILALVIGAANWPMVALAVVYLASRLWHTAIHTGSNAILPRFRAFFVGVLALMGMTALLALHLVAATAA